MPPTTHSCTVLVLDSAFGFRCTCGLERLLRRSRNHRLTPEAITALPSAHRLAVADTPRARRRRELGID